MDKGGRAQFAHSARAARLRDLSIGFQSAQSPGKLLAGFLAASAFLSMWLNNTATAAMVQHGDTRVSCVSVVTIRQWGRSSILYVE